MRHIRLRDIDLAAGAGAVVENEEVVGHLAFSADWLKQRGIDASQASIVRVTGRSMEPTLLEGSSVLVDETRRRRRAGEIFAIRSLDGGVVKRLEKDDRGRWLLVSDNPRYDPVAWGPDDELVGQVRWTARVL
ncbi:S24 family peptidase [Candidatus Palauibacter sp.]|uniref:S24 family peptidase n=1 Tax=Candidatus Palauibacter sp. TaxID=3101350 RepID=UPI003CC5429C